VEQQFAVTRERIRQIEAKALRKLKHPSRSRKMRSLLDQWAPRVGQPSFRYRTSTSNLDACTLPKSLIQLNLSFMGHLDNHSESLSSDIGGPAAGTSDD
jgi:hypothetical protein